MESQVKYIVISPVRNEAKHLPLTIGSMIKQTVLPARWIIVNDGSTDETRQIAEEAAHCYPWIKVINVCDRGFRQAGGGVVSAFYEGFNSIEEESWEYLVKLDGDLSFSPNYFEKCFEEFARNERLGIAGGTICGNVNGALEVESKVDPKFHVRGATKIYRRACWEQIGGLLKAPGWDTMDEVKANMLGWNTRTIAGVNVLHHRPTGAAYGAWRDRVKNGLGCYILGYHPLFMLLKSFRRFFEKPYVVGGCGLLFGFTKGFVCGVPQVEDKAVMKYFRQQQVNRLLFRKSLWD